MYEQWSTLSNASRRHTNNVTHSCIKTTKLSETKLQPKEVSQGTVIIREIKILINSAIWRDHLFPISTTSTSCLYLYPLYLQPPFLFSAFFPRVVRTSHLSPWSRGVSGGSRKIIEPSDPQTEIEENHQGNNMWKKNRGSTSERKFVFSRILKKVKLFKKVVDCSNPVQCLLKYFIENSVGSNET